MAIGIYQVEVKMSYGGTSSSKRYTNDFRVRGSDEFGSQTVIDMLTNVAEQFSNILTEAVTIHQVRATLISGEGESKYPRGSFNRISPNLAGTRVLAENVDPAPGHIVLPFNLNANGGYDGRMMVRGAISEAEFEGNAEGGVIIKPAVSLTVFNTFAAGLITTLNSAGYPLVLPPQLGQDFVTGHRLVTSIGVMPLATKQLTNKRKSIKTATKDVAQRAVNEVKAMFDDAKRDSSGWVNTLWVAAYNSFRAIVEQFGVALVLKLAVPPWLRILLLGAIDNLMPNMPAYPF